jgi:trans-2,3-dihydro-3-hydroxyanthranilate isomerase
MTLDFVTLDVFTTRRFGGNPLAVVFDPQADLSVERMQAIAREFNLSETTFVRPPKDPANDAEVRIFTPAFEMPWAGHPNVGTAWTLSEEAGIRAPRIWRFEELAGVVRVAVTAGEAGVTEARVTAPQPLTWQAAPTPEAMARCLGLEVSDLRLETHGPVAVSVGFPFPVVEVARREALARAQGRADVMADVLRPLNFDGVVAYCRETTSADAFDGEPSDLAARMFAPLAGITEDPATGSAMASLAAWLTQLDIDRGQATDGRRRLRIAQGVDLGRPSLLVTETSVVHGRLEAASVGGACVAVMKGRLTV